MEEYRKYIEKDAALERRFQTVQVSEPTVPEAIQILKGLRHKYESHHKLKYSDEALVAAAELSHRYINDRYLPDKAIDLIDEAGSKARLQSQRSSGELVVTGKHIEQLVAARTGIPVAQVSAGESERLLHMEELVRKRVIGQEEAVKAICSAVRRSRVGLHNPTRPIASFMFCGPTGVGKTELAKALACCYFGSEKAMVRLDMSEFMEKSMVSRLVGSSAGLVGYDDGGQLTEAVRRHPFSLVLLDEVEKAHPDVFNLFLQILDDGRLSDAKGKVVDFKNTIFILTSNVGSSAILQAASEGGLGYGDLKAVVTTELEKQFRPEFLNRLDDVIVFQQLNREQVAQIEDLLVQQFAERLGTKKVRLVLTPRCREHILNEGFNPTYGARPLRRAITRLLENEVAERLLDGTIKEGGCAYVDVDHTAAVLITNTPPPGLGSLRPQAPPHWSGHHGHGNFMPPPPQHHSHSPDPSPQNFGTFGAPFQFGVYPPAPQASAPSLHHEQDPSHGSNSWESHESRPFPSFHHEQDSSHGNPPWDSHESRPFPSAPHFNASGPSPASLRPNTGGWLGGPPPESWQHMTDRVQQLGLMNDEARPVPWSHTFPNGHPYPP